jgi:hypothetical protein
MEKTAYSKIKDEIFRLSREVNFANIHVSLKAISQAPRKSSRLFQICIDLRDTQNNFDANFFFSNICEKFNKIECVVTKKEENLFRIFLDTKLTDSKKFTTAQIYVYFFRLLFSNNSLRFSFIDHFEKHPIIIIKPNSLNEGICWATDGTFTLYTSLFNRSKFSESFKLREWANSNIDNTFSKTMPFIKMGGRISHETLEKYLRTKQQEFCKETVSLTINSIIDQIENNQKANNENTLQCLDLNENINEIEQMQEIQDNTLKCLDLNENYNDIEHLEENYDNILQCLDLNEIFDGIEQMQDNQDDTLQCFDLNEIFNEFDILINQFQ